MSDADQLGNLRRNRAVATIGTGGALVALSQGLQLFEIEAMMIYASGGLGLIVIVAGCAIFGHSLIAPVERGRWDEYRCVPLKEDDLALVHDMLVAQLGKDISTQGQMREWLHCNPTIFFVIKRKVFHHKDQNGAPVEVKTEIAGFFEIIPLKKGAVGQIEKGELDGRGLEASKHVTKKKGSPKAFYIGSIVGVDFKSKGFAIKQLIANMDRLTRKYNISLTFARPVTMDGLRIAKKYNYKRLKSETRPELGVMCFTHWRLRRA